jgi:hypothetical protein
MFTISSSSNSEKMLLKIKQMLSLITVKTMKKLDPGLVTE